VTQGIKKRGVRKEGEQMHVQVIVSRKDATNLIKLSPMNTSRGKNEAHSKKMGQFDRVAFKQSGESLFDSFFQFDRQLKDSMAYANTQINGSLTERLLMDKSDTELPLSSNNLHEEDHSAKQVAGIEQQYDTFSVPIQISITDDVDDEAVYGRNRYRKRQDRTNSR
jgi:hypothetical protein